MPLHKGDDLLKFSGIFLRKIMSSRISNRGNSQPPKDENDSVEEYDFSGHFDARAEDDGGIISSNEPKNIGQFIKKLIQSTREKISNWFQSASDYIKNKFTDSQGSRALANVRQHPALSIRQDIKYKSVTSHENSHVIDGGTSEHSDIQDEIFGKITQDENSGKITSENIQNNERYLEDFKKFKIIYGDYKNGKLFSIDNFKTENAKKYANDLIKNGEENLKNDPNYFFKNVAEYKDLVIASAVLDTKNKFALNNPLKDQQKNFKLWVTSKDPEAFAKLRTSEAGLSVNLQKAKVYADWVVFQNLIGELPDSVDQSIIPLATELRDMMESAKVETSIDSLNHDVNKITGDLMAFFEESSLDKVAPLRPSANDQRPVISVKSASVPESKPKSLVSSDPPPPPPPRLKIPDPAVKVNQATSPMDAPPPPPPPRVPNFSNTPATKTISREAVIKLRANAAPQENEVNLSMVSCVEKLNNLQKNEIDALRKIIAPSLNGTEFQETLKQSQLFFSDFMERRQIERDRQEYTKKLADLWNEGLKDTVTNIDLKKLGFYSELNNLFEMFKPRS